MLVIVMFSFAGFKVGYTLGEPASFEGKGKFAMSPQLRNFGNRKVEK